MILIKILLFFFFLPVLLVIFAGLIFMIPFTRRLILFSLGRFLTTKAQTSRFQVRFRTYNPSRQSHRVFVDEPNMDSKFGSERPQMRDVTPPRELS